MKINIRKWFNSELTNNHYNKEENCIITVISDMSTVKESMMLGFYNSNENDCPVIQITGNNEKIDFTLQERKTRDGDILMWEYEGNNSKGQKIGLTIFND